ncbi:MAG: dTDP-4-dehydrorhamnose reductase [Saprospiraceae bacterium]|jgi:dTDP-4-dehydrorhamnose reductase
MKVLIFGKNGQVGNALTALLADEDIVSLAKGDLDLTNLAEIQRCIATHQPDWVINAAAYTAVDLAESQEEAANRLNNLAPKAIAQACRKSNCMMIHYSTDYVFDGAEDKQYLESDLTNPKSAYGRTKLAGELAVLEALPRAIILRTAWVYAKQGANFVNTMLRLGKEKESLNIVSDQFGSPTLADDLAQATVDIMKQTNSENIDEVAGVYHATGSGSTTWFAFAQKIFEVSGNSKIQLTPVPTSAYPTAASRPSYSVLSNQKLKDTFGIVLPHWETALTRTLT